MTGVSAGARRPEPRGSGHRILISSRTARTMVVAEATTADLVLQFNPAKGRVKPEGPYAPNMFKGGEFA